MTAKKQHLFSLTKEDFEIQTFRAGGKGGQHQNKVESGVRIIHRASGAIGESREMRNQHQNRKRAFDRLITSSKFLAWHKIKVATVLAGIRDVDSEVEKMMRPENLKIEFY